MHPDDLHMMVLTHHSIFNKASNVARQLRDFGWGTVITLNSVEVEYYYNGDHIKSILVHQADKTIEYKTINGDCYRIQW